MVGGAGGGVVAGRGRERIMKSASLDWADTDQCLKCNICTAECPVYRVDAAFPGPKALGPDWYRRMQAGRTETHPHVSDCTFCQLCEAACPADVPVAHLIAWHKSRAGEPWTRRLRDLVLTHPHWVARWPRLMAVPRPLARGLGISTRSVRPSAGPSTPPARRHVAAARRRVGLLVDCYSRAFDRETVAAAEALLGLWGLAVIPVPAEAQCCGAAAYAGGQPDTAKRVAGAMERSLGALSPEAEMLVTLNATCDATIREEWPRYLGLRSGRNVVPFTEMALEAAPPSFWETCRRAPVEKVWVHTTCRSRVARGEGALQQLAQEGGGAPRSLGLACCGAGGSYAFKAEHEAVAHDLGSMPTGIDPGAVLLTDSGTCALHLGQLQAVRARHPAWWLYRRYRQGSA